MADRQRRQFMQGLGLGAIALAGAPTAVARPAGKVQNALGPVERFVTGHDADEHSRFILDGPPPRPHQRTPGSVTVTELWRTTSTPADNSGSQEAADGPLKLAPPAHGSVFRIIDFPPAAEHRAAVARELELGDDGSGVATALAHGGAKRPGFHRTNTIDYVVVISGEIHAVMDDGERLMRAGDVLVQRGTSHAWENRSVTVARVAFVLIDAVPAIESEG